MRLVRVYLDRLPEEIVDGYTYLLEPYSLQELVFAWADPPESAEERQEEGCSTGLQARVGG